MLVIFDFDGTLADTWPWLADELVSGADRLGYRSVTRADVERLRRMDTRTIFYALGIEADHLPSIVSDLRRRAEAAAPTFRLFDGMADLIRALRSQGVTLAVVSSNTESAVRATFGPDLAALFGAYRCDTDVFGKAEAFAEIMRTVRVTPNDTVAVGDETRDLEAANAAGIRGIAVAWGYADPDLLRSSAPGRVAATPAELGEMLTTASER